MTIYPEKQAVIGQYGVTKWRSVEEERRHRSTQVDLRGKKNVPFWFVMLPEIVALISEIERNRGVLATLPLPKKIRDQWARHSQKLEAYYSSHIEGAVTSLEAALLHLNKPTQKEYGDESLQMIINNKEALDYIRRQKDHSISDELICELQRILLRNTHKDRPITVGAYRRGPIYVVDGRGQIVYEGPPASDVNDMMNSYVTWLNGKSEFHPLIKAALVHLYFVHVHPFDDGNGRSARALSNLYLMKQDFQFINFLAPSDYFDHHRAQYYKAIQNTEAHECDATFFVLYYLEALAEQMRTVQIEIQKEARVKDLRQILKENVRARLDKKQIKALRWLLNHTEPLTTKKYCKLARCSDETARKDFQRLMEAGLIEKIGDGRSTGYVLKI